MKRMLSWLLALCLALSLAVPALAETEDMEAALQEITAHVKDVLEIDDDYARFSGDYSDGLRSGWYLYWSDDDRDLSVTCDEDGLVTDTYFWRNTGRSGFYGFDPAFPALGEDEARARAEEWLARLMGAEETARIDGRTVSLAADGEYRFYGTILLRGLESPVTFTLRLGAEGLASYSRSDSGAAYIGPVPDPTPAVTESAAGRALSEAVAFELYYVAEDGEARLRYVPVGPYTVVDAQSGEAVDMDALYASLGGSVRNGWETPMAAEASMAADEGSGRGLTEVELSSIANYKEALSQEELDARLRSLGDLGLGDFALDRCSYAMDGEGELTASLRYSCEMTADNLFGFSLDAFWDYLDWGGTPMVYKYVTMDAKTGELVSLSTSYPLWDRDRAAADPEEYPADAFLAAAAPEKFAESALCTLRGYEDGRTYARVRDGYFFPENYLYAEINPATGYVDDFRFAWDEDMTFAASKGIVDEAAARAAYTDALDLVLGYAAWPEAINYDDPVLYRYADWGYTYVESLRLGYFYTGTEDVAGVDALTGEAVTDKADGTFVYDDLDGIPQREAIEALGAAGIGFAGGRFRPAAALTMRDAAALLLQAAGYTVRDWDDETLGREAVWYGFAAPGEWDPDRTLTRMELLRMLLGASPYGAAAELRGVWAPGFTDVDAADEGVAAMARALGMVSGSKLDPDALCARSDGAELLYRFMNR